MGAIAWVAPGRQEVLSALPGDQAPLLGLPEARAGLVAAASDLLSTELRYRGEGGECVDTTLEAVDVSRLKRAATVRPVCSVAGRRNYPGGLFWRATTGTRCRLRAQLELDRLWLADFDAEVT